MGSIKNKKINEKHFQKNRFFQNPKNINLTFGDSGLITSREGFVELIHLTLFKKYLKYFLRKKKIKFIIYKRKDLIFW